MGQIEDAGVDHRDLLLLVQIDGTRDVIDEGDRRVHQPCLVLAHHPVGDREAVLGQQSFQTTARQMVLAAVTLEQNPEVR